MVLRSAQLPVWNRVFSDCSKSVLPQTMDTALIRMTESERNLIFFTDTTCTIDIPNRYFLLEDEPNTLCPLQKFWYSYPKFVVVIYTIWIRIIKCFVEDINFVPESFSFKENSGRFNWELHAYRTSLNAMSFNCTMHTSLRLRNQISQILHLFTFIITPDQSREYK